MANIGTFTKTEQGFVGEIVTLSFQAKNVRIVPERTAQRERPKPPRLCRPSRLCGVERYAEWRGFERRFFGALWVAALRIISLRRAAAPREGRDAAAADQRDQTSA